MARTVGLLGLFFFSVVATLGAGDYEYGTAADLKGKSTYFVFTGTDIATRNEIAAKLRQETDQLQLASSPDEAQVFVDVEGSDRDDDGAKFVVYVTGKEGRRRLIEKFAYTHSKFPRLRPTSRFARDFAKLWRDAQAGPR